MTIYVCYIMKAAGLCRHHLFRALEEETYVFEQACVPLSCAAKIQGGTMHVVTGIRVCCEWIILQYFQALVGISPER